MAAVVMLALAGLIALLIAVLTGSTAGAVAAITCATLGIVLLLRDWRKARKKSSDPTVGPPLTDGADNITDAGSLRADMFKPDISTDPDGPSSNARAD